MIDQHEIKVTDTGSGYVVGTIQQHKRLTYLNGGTLVVLCDGVDTLLNFVTDKMPTPKRGESSSNSRDDDDDFNAFKSYEEAMQVFRHKPEQIVKFDPSELKIKDDSESGQRVDYDVVGDYIDMGRYMEGIPESWGSMRNGNARNRRVNIMVDLNQVWSTRHEDVTHRGERILRLVDALEAGGVRTQITGIASNECGHTEIILKRHEEPLTISDLAIVSHPEFLRRIIFRINEYSETWDWGYGSAVKFGDTVSRDPEIIKSDSNDEMNIFIGASMNGTDLIDNRFDKLEKLLQWEMSKPVPEVDSVKVDSAGVYFNPNGMRSESEIRREGLEAIEEEL